MVTATLLQERFQQPGRWQTSYRLSQDVSAAVERIAVQSGVTRNLVVSALLRLALQQCGHI